MILSLINVMEVIMSDMEQRFSFDLPAPTKGIDGVKPITEGFNACMVGADSRKVPTTPPPEPSSRPSEELRSKVRCPLSPGR